LIQEIGREIGAWQTAVQRFDELAALRMNLHVTDLQIIDLLHHGGPLPAGQLGKAAGLSPGAATAAIDRLEQTGYVQRSRTLTDRRQVIVQLTARSRRLVEDIWELLVQEGIEKLRSHSINELVRLRDFVQWCRELQLRHIARLKGEGSRRSVTSPSGSASRSRGR
jgi:DNA-binding MarR family transcriptional regulator